MAQNIELHNTFGEIVLEQATKANDMAKLSTKTFLSKISELYGIRSGRPNVDDNDDDNVEINWVAMGKAAAVFFNGPPKCSFLHGAMMKNVVEKKRNNKRKRVGRDTKSAAATAGVLDNLKESDDKDDSVKLMFSVAATCKEINQKKKAKTDFLELVVDPSSFPKTIENMFAASFLVKENKLRINVDPETNIPMVYNSSALNGENDVSVYQGPSQAVQGEGVEAISKDTSHCVIALNYHDWQKLCHAIEPESGKWEPIIDRPEPVSEEEEEEEVTTDDDDNDDDDDDDEEDDDDDDE